MRKLFFLRALCCDQKHNEQENIGHVGRDLGAGGFDIRIDAVGNEQQAGGKDTEEQDHGQRSEAFIEIGPGGRLNRRLTKWGIDCKIGHIDAP